jgi:phospholipase/carboxylesterase
MFGQLANSRGAEPTVRQPIKVKKRSRSSMELLHTAHVPAGRGPFPTILALHGFGASAHDLLGIAPIVTQVVPGEDVLFLCPQGPVVLEPAPGEVAYAWFPLAGGGEIEMPSLVAARGILEAFVEDAMETYPIDPERLVIMGFSQGGVMAYDLALGRPEKYAALIALSTWLPDLIVEGLQPDEARARLATLLIHGTEDPMVAFENGQASKGKLEELGIHAAWGEYEMGHEISQNALRDLLGWLAQGAFAIAED